MGPAHAQRFARRAERARHVRDLLRMEILGGVHGWKLLPSEPALMIRFGTSRNTVRDALDLLRREGIVERVPGAGTFVVSAKAVHHHDRLQALAENIENGHQRVAVDVLDAGIMPAPILVSAKLQLEQDAADVVFLERRLNLDGSPVVLWSSYLPVESAGGLLSQDLTRDFYELVERRLGIELRDADISVESRLADESVAELLRISSGAPMLFLERLVRECSGRPVEFGFAWLRGDRIKLVSQLTRAMRERQS